MIKKILLVMVSLFLLGCSHQDEAQIEMNPTTMAPLLNASYQANSAHKDIYVKGTPEYRTRYNFNLYEDFSAEVEMIYESAGKNVSFLSDRRLLIYDESKQFYTFSTEFIENNELIKEYYIIDFDRHFPRVSITSQNPNLSDPDDLQAASFYLEKIK